MRAFWNNACFWVGAVILSLLACSLVLSGLHAIYVAGQANGRAQVVGYQPAAPSAPRAVAPASQPATPAAPATPQVEAPASQPAPPPPPAAPTRRLTIVVDPDGACRIGIDVPSDAGQRRRFVQQRRQLGLGPCD